MEYLQVKQYTICLIISVFLITISSCAQEKGNGQNSLYSNPESQQMSSEQLIKMVEIIKQEKCNIHSLLISRNDTVVFDSYFYPYQKSFVHDLASVTKSITSLLIGIAIDKGFITDENQEITGFFPEYKVSDTKFNSIRIKDLLNMASGSQCSWNDGERELHQMIESEDWIKFMYNLSFVSDPGKSFSYCSGNYYLLSEIIQRTTKMSCHEFAKKYLFEPMAISESYWLTNKKGVNQGWGDLCLSPLSLSKIGSLIIHNGKWQGKQIISENWLSKLTPQYKINDEEEYGLGWWFENEQPNMIEAIGRGGQRLVIYKKLKMVIVIFGGGFDSGDIDNYILESLSKYNKDSNKSKDLTNLLNQVSQPPAPTSNSNNSIEFLKIDKQEYEFDDNGLGLVSCGFKVKNSIPLLILKLKDGSKEEHEIGLNNQFAYGKERAMQLPIAIKGQWINDTTLKIEYNELCRINRYMFTFTFKKDTIALRVQGDGEDETNLIGIKKK